MAGPLRRIVGALLVELGRRVHGNPGFRDADGEEDEDRQDGEGEVAYEPTVSERGRAMLERPRRVERAPDPPERPLDGSLEARGFVRRAR